MQLLNPRNTLVTLNIGLASHLVELELVLLCCPFGLKGILDLSAFFMAKKKDKTQYPPTVVYKELAAL